MSDSDEEAEKSIAKAFASMKEKSAPFALVARHGIFEPYALKHDSQSNFELLREDAIKLIVKQLDENDIIISTTGMASRELFEYRDELKQSHEKDFLTVGSMGHSSQIALGIALSKTKKNVYCLDGDGAVIMHMGALAIIGELAPKNFKHIIINNGAHDSVGGQPTAGFQIDIASIAKACGYELALNAKTKQEVINSLSKLKSSKGLSLLEIKVRKGHRKDLGRPTKGPKENKKTFMHFLQKD